MIDKLRYIGVAIALVSAGACQVTNQSDVSSAAEQRWEALISGNIQKAYQFYSDAFKKTMPIEKFKKQIRGVGLWQQAKVVKTDCDESQKKCHVNVKVTVRMKMKGLVKPVETSSIIQEVWVQEGWFSHWRYMDK